MGSKSMISNRTQGVATVRRIGGALADLVYPPCCVMCRTELSQRPSLAICDDCRHRLVPPMIHWCRLCSAPVDGMATESEHCIHCFGKSFPWKCAVALGRYRGDLSRAILRTKRPRSEPLTILLAELLFAERTEALRELNADCVVPMPMHWIRRWRRGANGPEILAEALAARLRLPLKTRWLRRCKITPLQTDLSPPEREKRQRRSFRIGRGSRIRGHRVLLVDDVLTTGATAAEASRVLLANGAQEVCVAAIARGIGEDAL